MLCYLVSDLCLVGYNDADWGGDLDKRKSTFGYAFLLNNGATSQSGKKQSSVALSTMESEYVTCSATIQEYVWLRRFIAELGIVAHALEPVTIHRDNVATLTYAKDPKYHGKNQTH